MSAVVTLLTDFGLEDTYVGVMRGVIASLCPEAIVIDLTHQVPPQDIATGAFLLDISVDYFPEGAIHVAVVDPGVGTARKPVALRTSRAFFVGPDNGIFTLVLQRWKLLQAVCLDNPRYHLSEVSATFHGRDIFAPVAAHLARGTPLEELGSPITRLQRLPLPRIRVDWQGIRATIVHIDRFGNAITNLTRADYETWRNRWGVEEPVVEVAAKTQVEICRTYADVPRGQPLALFGSSGRLEVAVNGGNAAQTFLLRRGDTVKVLRRETTPPPRVQRTLGLE
ncbi:MAG: SAM-dependent chlorinase/fluorinase [Armatimonadota bacterium]|nr:SAM-dependent chlorinase/fluorinase [Armatimonadota bacterium]MDW8290843.1 SAM-dependent chlorinase/fluorinase [Armatimonadota bacterium]